jgi:hypothetical protein
MQRNIIFLAIWGYCFLLKANGQQNDFSINSASDIKIFDANGKPFVNPHADIAGSPYFIDGWKYGFLFLTNSTLYSKRLVKIDVVNQEVHYMAEKNVEMTLPEGLVKKIILLDSSGILPSQYTFRCELPSIDNQSEKSLYLVLSVGKINLLKSIRKKIIIDKNDFSGEINKEYRTYEDYYFFTGAHILRIKKDRDFIISVLKDKKDQLDAYIKKSKPNYKSIEDIVKLVDYYNSL